MTDPWVPNQKSGTTLTVVEPLPVVATLLLVIAIAWAGLVLCYGYVVKRDFDLTIHVVVPPSNVDSDFERRATQRGLEVQRTALRFSGGYGR